MGLMLICLGLLATISGCVSQDISLRLINNGAEAYAAGRVEVNDGSGWGMICDDAFEEVDANAICRFLGFDGADAFHVGAAGYQTSGAEELFGVFMPDETPLINLDDLGCTDDSTSINDCITTAYGNHNCERQEQVGVSCTVPQIDIRLNDNGVVDGSQGRVEVNDGSGWGMICDDAFDDTDADAICRLLGFSGADAMFLGAAGYQTSASEAAFGVFSPDADPLIAMDDLACPADAAYINQCLTMPYGSHNCQRQEQVGLQCSAIRLVSQGVAQESEGRVEVYMNGEWGMVCDDSFAQREGDAFCRFLGFSGASEVLVGGGGYQTTASVERYGEFEGMIAMDDVSCPDDATALSDCDAIRDGDSPGHNCENQEQVGLVCA